MKIFRIVDAPPEALGARSITVGVSDRIFYLSGPSRIRVRFREQSSQRVFELPMGIGDSFAMPAGKTFDRMDVTNLESEAAVITLLVGQGELLRGPGGASPLTNSSQLTGVAAIKKIGGFGRPGSGVAIQSRLPYQRGYDLDRLTLSTDHDATLFVDAVLGTRATDVGYNSAFPDASATATNTYTILSQGESNTQLIRVDDDGAQGDISTKNAALPSRRLAEVAMTAGVPVTIDYPDSIRVPLDSFVIAYELNAPLASEMILQAAFNEVVFV